MSRPIICAILNATPDSFYDGGKYDNLFVQAEKLIDAGADWLDIGGESTRPNADVIGEQEEMDRVLPLVEKFASYVPISIDTTKPNVAKEAQKSGATILNDVQGLQNPEMQEVSAIFEQTIIMHSRGTPKTMTSLTQYDNIIEEISDFFIQQSQKCLSQKIWFDPGIGFAKTPQQSMLVLKECHRFTTLGHPVLIGASRKSFIGHFLHRQKPSDRLFGSLAAVAAGFYGKAEAFRVHDVAETKDVLEFLRILSEIN